MFKLLRHFSRSLPLSQILLSISCLLTTSAIANPIPTPSLDRVNTSQDSPILNDRLALEVPNSMPSQENVDNPLSFEEFLADAIAEISMAENPDLPCPTSTSTNDSIASSPLPTRESETAESTSPPISCVANLTGVPTSIEFLKTTLKRIHRIPQQNPLQIDSLAIWQNLLTTAIDGTLNFNPTLPFQSAPMGRLRSGTAPLTSISVSVKS
jgi:hypothetical protein